MKIVHAADLHLDSPLTGLVEYEGAPVAEVRSATRRALSALVDLCIEEEASLLLIAGDLYDGDFRDYSTALCFTQQMARLQEADVQVVWLRGNHDAVNLITKHLRASENVTELSHSEPQTKVFEHLGVAVHGQGYAKRDVTENLAAHYPAPLPGLVNLGLLHTALDGRPGHAPYAPCSLKELVGHGYDYWALGHVHQREILAREPWVVFPGNVQGRHARETGPKGATLIEVNGGRIDSVEPRILDVVRWETTRVDASDCATLLDVVDAAATRMDQLLGEAGERVLSTRVVVQGRSSAHGLLVSRAGALEAELRSHCVQRGDLYLERVVVETEGQMSTEALAERHDALGDLFRAVSELRADPEALAEVERRVLEPLSGLATELLREEGVDFRELLADAEKLLEGRMMETPEDGSRT